MSIAPIVAILKRHLAHPKWHSFHKQIATQLYVVRLGIKTGFIWDIGPTVRLSVLQDIVAELNDIADGGTTTKILNLGLDFCIVNVTAYLHRCIDDITFVDVTQGSADGPQVTSVSTNSMLCEQLHSIHSTISNSNEDTIIVDIPHTFCVPTLFGLFAGYPIVYWYDPSLGATGNCLAGEPLQVFRLSCNDTLVLSASCPERILLCNNGTLLKRMVKWFERLAKDNARHNLTFNRLPTTMSTVIL